MAEHKRKLTRNRPTKPTDPVLRIFREPGPGIEDPRHLRPGPQDASHNSNVHPQLEPLEGPTEASTNKDDLMRQPADGPHVTDLLVHPPDAAEP